MRDPRLEADRPCPLCRCSSIRAPPTPFTDSTRVVCAAPGWNRTVDARYTTTIRCPMTENHVGKQQIGYNIFLSFLGNKKADDEDLKTALVPADGSRIERFAEDIKED